MKNKTERMVEKYFCSLCQNFGKDFCRSCIGRDFSKMIRAARAFVRMENKGKLRLLDIRDVEFENQKPITGLPKDPNYFSKQRKGKREKYFYLKKYRPDKVTNNLLKHINSNRAPGTAGAKQAG